jgi:Mg2+ and Co2+ transporter CorA
VIVVYSIAKGSPESAAPLVARKAIGPGEPIPVGAIWIDMIAPTMEEDRLVQALVGVPIPTKADPDFDVRAPMGVGLSSRAFLLMVFAAVGPYVLFRWKRWL